MKKLNLKESVEAISNHTGMDMKNIHTDWNKCLEVYRVVDNTNKYPIELARFVSDDNMKRLVKFMANTIIKEFNDQNKVSGEYTTELNTTTKDIINGSIQFDESNRTELIKELNQINIEKLTPKQTNNLVRFISSMNNKDIQDYILHIIDNKHIYNLDSQIIVEFLGRFQYHMDVLSERYSM